MMTLYKEAPKLERRSTQKIRVIGRPRPIFYRKLGHENGAIALHTIQMKWRHLIKFIE